MDFDLVILFLLAEGVRQFRKEGSFTLVIARFQMISKRTPFNPQPRPWRSGSHHCLMPVSIRPKSRVGSNPREALFEVLDRILEAFVRALGSRNGSELGRVRGRKEVQKR